MTEGSKDEIVWNPGIGIGIGTLDGGGEEAVATPSGCKVELTEAEIAALFDWHDGRRKALEEVIEGVLDEPLMVGPRYAASAALTDEECRRRGLVAMSPCDASGPTLRVVMAARHRHDVLQGKLPFLARDRLDYNARVAEGRRKRAKKGRV